MKILIWSKRKIQKAVVEKKVRLRILYENFIIEKLGKTSLKELHEKEIKMRLKSASKIKNPLDMAVYIAESDKNVNGSKVKVQGDKYKAILIINECGYLRQDTIKRKQTCCKPCLKGRIDMAKSLKFQVKGILLKKGCKFTFWR
jgi:hypothetical protein